MDDVYFPTVADLRKWFEANHDKLDEAWFGFYKVGTGVPSITYKDAVDECLCFGWIDGVRYTVDEQRWRERFTPRRAGSFWSSVNTKRALELDQFFQVDWADDIDDHEFFRLKAHDRQAGDLVGESEQINVDIVAVFLAGDVHQSLP